MIIVSKERYLPVMTNTLILQKDEHYFYVHRDVYDQMVILEDRYLTNMEELQELVGGCGYNEQTIAWFAASAPKPLRILAPFLALVDGKLEQDLELICGVLHVIASMINMRGFILKPAEVRRSVTFSLTIKEEYQMAWDRFFMSSVPYGEWVGRMLAVPPAGGRTVEDTQPLPAAPVHWEKTSLLDMEQSVAAIEAFISAGPTSPTEAEKSATRKLLQLL